MVIFALLTTLFGIQSAMAGIVDTGTVISEQAAGERDRIFALIEREDARKRLTQYGVPADQAGERIAALTEPKRPNWPGVSTSCLRARPAPSRSFSSSSLCCC